MSFVHDWCFNHDDAIHILKAKTMRNLSHLEGINSFRGTFISLDVKSEFRPALLKEVYLLRPKYDLLVADHLWLRTYKFHLDPCDLKNGDKWVFDAVVWEYQKSKSNQWDCTLRLGSKIKVLHPVKNKKPSHPKKYEISYIRERFLSWFNEQVFEDGMFDWEKYLGLVGKWNEETKFFLPEKDLKMISEIAFDWIIYKSGRKVRKVNEKSFLVR
jgi:hypothetical protein